MNLVSRRVLGRYTFMTCNKFFCNYALKVPCYLGVTSINSFRYRNYCEKSAKTLPRFMDFPYITSPSLTYSVKNFFKSLFIRRVFEHEFSLLDFTMASRHAVEVVSNALSQNDFNALKDLVKEDAITTLKDAVSKLSTTQRHLLAIDKEEIFNSFPYEVVITTDEATGKSWVEIVMVYYVKRGYPNLSIEQMMNKDDELIINFRFIREFTKGVDDSWWVNLVNYIKVDEYIESL